MQIPCQLKKATSLWQYPVGIWFPFTWVGPHEVSIPSMMESFVSYKTQSPTVVSLCTSILRESNHYHWHLLWRTPRVVLCRECGGLGNSWIRTPAILGMDCHDQKEAEYVWFYFGSPWNAATNRLFCFTYWRQDGTDTPRTHHTFILTLY